MLKLIALALLLSGCQLTPLGRERDANAITILCVLASCVQPPLPEQRRVTITCVFARCVERRESQ